MPKFIEGLKSLGEIRDRRRLRGEKSPIQLAAVENRGRILKDFHTVLHDTGPEMIQGHNEWYARQLGKMGIGTGAEFIAMDERYLAGLAEMALNQVIAGGNIAQLLADAGKEINRVIADKDPENRMTRSLSLCHTVVTRARKGKGNWETLAGLNLFSPWMGVLKMVDNKRFVLRDQLKGLDKAVIKSEENLRGAGKAISGSANNVTKAAKEYDQNLNLFRTLEGLRQESGETAARMVTSLSRETEPVSSLAQKMQEHKQNLARIPEDAIKANNARAAILREVGMVATETIAVNTLAEIDKATKLNREATLIVGTTLPLVGMASLSRGVTAGSWISTWAMFEIASRMGVIGDIRFDSETVLKLIREHWQATQNLVSSNQKLILPEGLKVS